MRRPHATPRRRRIGPTGGHRARLSSLAALAGAAVATGAGSAHAGVISAIYNSDNSFTLAVGQSILSTHNLTVGTHHFALAADQHFSASGPGSGNIHLTAPSLRFAANGTIAAIVAAGATQAGTHHAATVLLQHISTTSAQLGAFGVPDVTDGYALFQFQNGATTDHGWIELSVSNDAKAGSSKTTILAAAYDNTGAALPAGSLGAPASVPEPSSLAIEMSGLAALALGATAHRRWCAARRTRSALGASSVG